MAFKIVENEFESSYTIDSKNGSISEEHFECHSIVTIYDYIDTLTLQIDCSHSKSDLISSSSIHLTKQEAIKLAKSILFIAENLKEED